MIDTLWQDVKFAARSLRRTPGFTAAAVVTLALGIGANATIFTLLDAVLFKPLPVSRPDELFALYENAPDAAPDALPDSAGGTGRFLRFSYPRFLHLQEALGDDGQLAGTTLSTRFVGRVQGSPQVSPILTQLVSGLYFSTLGAEMQRGRPITDSDMQRDERGHVAVISDGYWKRGLGRTEQALGQTIVIRGVALTIVGIARAEFVGVRTDSVADLWVPLTLQDSLGYSTNRSDYGSSDQSKPWMDEDHIAWLNLVARVPAGGRGQAITRLQNANAQGLRQLAESVKDPREGASTIRRSLVVTPFERGFSALRSRYSDALYALATMVGIVLLVTCANIANLLLARATGRSRETSIRLSLGATTGRLVRQHLAESLLLAGAGGAMSLLAAQWTSELMARAVLGRTGELPPVFSLDARVWIFTVALSFASALAFGVAPALRAVRAGLVHGISVNQRVTTHAALRGMRPLVAAQLALSFSVVFGAVLLGRTLTYFARIDPGFNPERVVTATIDPNSSGYSREQVLPLVDRLLAAIRAIPGVETAAVTTCGLMTNCSYSSGYAVEGAGTGIQLNNNWIAPTYFATVGIPFVAGRDFTDRDTEQSPRVAIISESIARRFFPGQNPLGRRLGRGELDTEIVGVVRDVRPTLHAEPEAMIYVPTQQPPRSFTAPPRTIAVRVSGDVGYAVSAIRASIQRTEPGLLLDNVSTMSAALDRDVARERLIAYLAGSFAVLALLLACIGLYGVLSYTVARRTQEIGVRMALGARPGDLTRMVIGDGSRVVLAGVAMGTAAAIGVGRLITTLLTGVSPSDPITLIAVGISLGGVALAASYIPARRAARVNPIAALRME
jgi:macrolide transport system ATP-binding/permease protein